MTEDNMQSDYAKERTRQQSYVCCESIKGNLVQKISIPTKGHPGRTTVRFPCDATHRRHCDFSMDQVARANFEDLAVISHLPDFSIFLGINRDDKK